jgi:hypothetical protein
VFSRRHLDSLKVQLQENLELFFNQMKLHVNDRKIYFICIGRPKHPNPKTQITDNTIRLLHPHHGHLTPQQCTQIQQLCDERLPPPPELEPPLIGEDVDDNEQGLVADEIVVEAELLEHDQEQDEEEEHRLPHQLTHYYNNALATFEREFEEWMQHEYHHHCSLFEEQQLEAYQCTLTFLPAMCQPQEEHQQDHPLEQQQPPEEDVEMIRRQQ